LSVHKQEIENMAHGREEADEKLIR